MHNTTIQDATYKIFNSINTKKSDYKKAKKGVTYINDNILLLQLHINKSGKIRKYTINKHNTREKHCLFCLLYKRIPKQLHKKIILGWFILDDFGLKCLIYFT